MSLKDDQAKYGPPFFIEQSETPEHLADWKAWHMQVRETALSYGATRTASELSPDGKRLTFFAWNTDLDDTDSADGKQE